MVISFAPVPKQFGDAKDKNMIGTAATTTVIALVSTFALSFLLRMLISSAMSEMWTFQSWLQLIMTLPLMQVIMPANVILFRQAVEDVINFQLVEPDVIYGILGVQVPSC